MSLTKTERATRVVRADRWDLLEEQDTFEQLPALTEAAGRLADVDPAAPDVLPDLWQLFMRAQPELVDRNDVAPTHATNRAVLGEFEESDACRAHRSMTVGKRVQAAIACMGVVDDLRKLYDKVGPELAEQRQRVQDALDALDQLRQRAEAGDPEAGEDAVAGAEASATEAQDALNEAVDRQTPEIGRAVRRAAERALDKAERQAADMAGWGVDPGSPSMQDPTAYLELAARLNTPRMRAIAAMVGRMKNEAMAARRTRVTNVPEEIFDVTLGAELARLLPSELVSLAVPELKVDFLRRFVEGGLLCYDLRGYEKQARGPVVVVEDGSGSMSGPKELWAKAVSLTLLSIAHSEGRTFAAVQFAAGASDTRVFTFTPDQALPEQMLTYAASFIDGGGTSFAAGLDPALAILEAEVGSIRSDIVFITDGEAKVRPEWLADFRSRIEALGATVFGVAIGATRHWPAFDSICDRRCDVQDLVSGSEVREIFAGVS